MSTRVDKVKEIARGLLSGTLIRQWSRQQRRGWRFVLLRQIGLFILAARSIDKNVAMRAAGLTYRSLLALVPLLVVAFAIFGAFGGMDQMREPLIDWILDALAVEVEGLRERIDTFLGNINAGAIAGAGAIGLVYTAVGLLIDVESSINRMWGIRKGRPFLVSLARNWALITLAPLLLAYSLSLSSSLQNSEFAETVLSWLPLGLGPFLLTLTTVLAMSLAFTMAYMVIPNTKVKIRSALAGGIVSGVLWSILKSIFIATVASSVKYSAIYGALGVLPILMIWMYFGWIIVLFGASFAHANQVGCVTHVDQVDSLMSHGDQERVVLRIVLEVCASFVQRGKPPTDLMISLRTNHPLPVVNHLVQVLIDQRILARAKTGPRAEEGLIPDVDLSTTTAAAPIKALIDWAIDGHAFENQRSDSDFLIREARAAAMEILARESLLSLTQRWLQGELQEEGAPLTLPDPASL